MKEGEVFSPAAPLPLLLQSATCFHLASFGSSLFHGNGKSEGGPHTIWVHSQQVRAFSQLSRATKPVVVCSSRTLPLFIQFLKLQTIYRACNINIPYRREVYKVRRTEHPYYTQSIRFRLPSSDVRTRGSPSNSMFPAYQYNVVVLYGSISFSFPRFLGRTLRRPQINWLSHFFY